MVFHWDSSTNSDQRPLAEFILRVSEERTVDDWVKELRGELLRAQPGRRDHFGYDGGDDWVARRVFAIQDHLRKVADCEVITWSAASGMAERLLSPSEVLREKKASCAQAAIMFCAVALKLELHPLFLAVGDPDKADPDHAIVAIWLEDRALKSPVSGEKDIEPHTMRLLFMDATGFLCGSASTSAEDAHAKGIAWLPQVFRNNTWRWREKMHVPFQADKRIFYCIDLRAYQRSVPSVIAVIGTGGGVGKTTVSGCVAECIDSTTSRPVVIVDLDIENHALTSRHLREGPSDDRPLPITVEDILRQLRLGNPLQGVAPVPVRHPKSSHILCIPSDGSLPGDDDVFLDAVRDCANEWVKQVLMAASRCNPVAVVVDCRSAHAPEVSALCQISTVVIVVAVLGPEVLKRRGEILDTHRKRILSVGNGSASFRDSKFALCLNQCGPAHLNDRNPLLQGEIPENARLRNAVYSGGFQSYLRYPNIAESVTRMLRVLPLQHLPLRMETGSRRSLRMIAERLARFGGSA